MISRSTFLHLRIPFSLFLLPVFLFALSISNNPDLLNVLQVLLIVHLFLYPASNAYNSYFDRDEKSIGGLRHPPAVTKELYYTALIFDLIAILLGLLINLWFSIMLVIYGLVSKAYSHPSVRLKQYPYLSWFTAGFFQGFFTLLMCYVGINNVDINNLSESVLLFAAILSSLMLWGSYPMTQIYQHEEDKKRGDITLSLKLGILPTFYFTGAFFMLATAAFLFFYYRFFDTKDAITFIACTFPMVLYFLYWYMRVRTDESRADFSHSMKLNTISSLCLSIFFIWMTVQYSAVF